MDEYTADKTILDKLIAVTDVGFAAVYKSNRTNNDLDHDLDLFISHHRFFYFMTQLYYFNNKQRKVLWSLDFENLNEVKWCAIWFWILEIKTRLYMVSCRFELLWFGFSVVTHLLASKRSIKKGVRHGNVTKVLMFLVSLSITGENDTFISI